MGSRSRCPQGPWVVQTNSTNLRPLQWEANVTRNDLLRVTGKVSACCCLSDRALDVFRSHALEGIERQSPPLRAFSIETMIWSMHFGIVLASDESDIQAHPDQRLVEALVATTYRHAKEACRMEDGRFSRSLVDFT